MANKSNPHELELVLTALTCNLSNCVEWCDEKTEQRIRNSPDLQGLTPEGIKAEVRKLARQKGEVVQVAEERSPYKNEWGYYYKAIIFAGDADFPQGVFVEMRLATPDEDCPVVWLVNAHPQRS